MVTVLSKMASILARSVGAAGRLFHSSPVLEMVKTKGGRVNYTYPGLAKHNRFGNINGRERRRLILEGLKRKPRSQTSLSRVTKAMRDSKKSAAEKAAEDPNALPKVTSTKTTLKMLEKNARRSFEEIGLRPDIVNALAAKGIARPTEIQALGIPEILKGMDVLLAAETGSGKTLAYILPLMQKLKEEEEKGLERRFSRPRALIILPSRELAQQVTKVLKMFAHEIRLRSVLLSGMGTRRHERDALDSLVDIVVATPGRLFSHRENGILSFSEVRYVVIDEADSMLDSGFAEEMKSLILPIQMRKSDVPKTFITVTATLPKPVDAFLSSTFKNCVRVTTPTLHRTVPTLRQRFIPIRGHSGPKHVQILNILKETPAKKTLIFCNTTGSCVALHKFFDERKLNAAHLHGDLKPEERTAQLEKFVEGDSKILVATDIASRGLDTTLVDHVIIFDFPKNAIDYLHRVGRTARNGSVGRATSMIGRKDRKLAFAISSSLRRGLALGWAPANQATAAASSSNPKQFKDRKVLGPQKPPSKRGPANRSKFLAAAAVAAAKKFGKGKQQVLRGRYGWESSEAAAPAGSKSSKPSKHKYHAKNIAKSEALFELD